MIFSDTYVITRHVFSPTLTNDDVTGDHALTSEDFYTKAFTV
jgi:hypothetical protein